MKQPPQALWEGSVGRTVLPSARRALARHLSTILVAFLTISLSSFAQENPNRRPATSLREVRRIFVSRLAGGGTADSMREVLIASLNSTGLFVLTDDQTKADAVLKGAANDTIFVDSFDSDKSISGRTDGGFGNRSLKTGGAYGSLSGADREAYHIRDRKHEAYAAIRLVNRAGDTLWSTTQESLGSKFHSASADVGEKVARQIALDMDRLQRAATSRQ